jgi:hypothetical protein
MLNFFNIIFLNYFFLDLIYLNSGNIYLIIFFIIIFFLNNFYSRIIQYYNKNIIIKEMGISKKKNKITVLAFWYYILLVYLRFVMYKNVSFCLSLMNRHLLKGSYCFLDLYLKLIKYKLDINLINFNITYFSKKYIKKKEKFKNINYVVYFI